MLYFVPDLNVNLISVCSLTQKGYNVIFTDTEYKLIKSGVVELAAKRIGRSYTFRTVCRANLTSTYDINM